MFKNYPQWKSQQKTLSATVLEAKKLPGPTRKRDCTKIVELFADKRCSQAILDFLAKIDVGRMAGPPVAEEGYIRRRGQRGLRVGRQRTRGAARTVERGGGETWRREVGG